jgi:hypothetical protein
MAFMRTVAIGVGALALAACASSVSVNPQMTKTASSISAAEAVGARQHPPAALYLKMARDQLRAAQALIAEDETEEARMLLERAEVDAQLALVLTKAEEASRDAREAGEQVRELQSRER